MAITAWTLTTIVAAIFLVGATYLYWPHKDRKPVTFLITFLIAAGVTTVAMSPWRRYFPTAGGRAKRSPAPRPRTSGKTSSLTRPVKPRGWKSTSFRP